ncbi:MAG: YciI family protein [Pirellulales bacterium]
MKYMLLCYDDEQAWQQAGKAALDQAMQEAVELTHELDARGQYLVAAPLHSALTATTVRVRNGKPLVTDGPFAETREVLGGFYLIDVQDLNEAISVAQRHPGARVGSVEIRPVIELAGLPPRRTGI